MDLPDDDERADDVGYDLDEAQAAIHSGRDTRKQMEKVANQIWDSLRECASTMTTIPEPRRGRRR
jgi:hypothetical protein